MPRPSILGWFLGLFDWGLPSLETGAYYCPVCLGVYDDIEQHRCRYTAQCLDCHQRTVLEDNKCSKCDGSSYVLVRRGM